MVKRSKLIITTIIVFFVLISCSGNNSLTNHNNNEGTWITRASMPVAVQEIYPVGLNGSIYILGGFDIDSNAVNDFQVFHPLNNTWSNETDFPHERHHVNLAVADGKIYAMGGYNVTRTNRFNFLESAYEYNPVSQIWDTIPHMPTPRAEMSVVSFDDKIYAIGGRLPGQNPIVISNANEMYDPLTETWTVLSPMPSGRRHSSAAVIDSLIYVVGGRVTIAGATLNVNALEAYSPASDTWYILESLPENKGAISVATYNRKLYVFGGEKINYPQRLYDAVDEYDPATDTWRTINVMNTPRHGTNAVTIADTIFVIGGGNSPVFGASDVNEGFIPPQD